jgi:hypothetical protein
MAFLDKVAKTRQSVLALRFLVPGVILLPFSIGLITGVPDSYPQSWLLLGASFLMMGTGGYMLYRIHRKSPGGGGNAGDSEDSGQGEGTS